MKEKLANLINYLKYKIDFFPTRTFQILIDNNVISSKNLKTIDDIKNILVRDGWNIYFNRFYKIYVYSFFPLSAGLIFLVFTLGLWDEEHSWIIINFLSVYATVFKFIYFPILFVIKIILLSLRSFFKIISFFKSKLPFHQKKNSQASNEWNSMNAEQKYRSCTNQDAMRMYIHLKNGTQTMDHLTRNLNWDLDKNGSIFKYHHDNWKKELRENGLKYPCYTKDWKIWKRV